jgi:hypothetical protein
LIDSSSCFSIPNHHMTSVYSSTIHSHSSQPRFYYLTNQSITNGTVPLLRLFIHSFFLSLNVPHIFLFLNYRLFSFHVTVLFVLVLVILSLLVVKIFVNYLSMTTTMLLYRRQHWHPCCHQLQYYYRRSNTMKRE